MKVEVLVARCRAGWMDGGGALRLVESSLHDALEDDDLVVVHAGGQRAQGLDVRGHVLQVMSPPHWIGEVGPALQHTAGNSHTEVM